MFSRGKHYINMIYGIIHCINENSVGNVHVMFLHCLYAKDNSSLSFDLRQKYDLDSFHEIHPYNAEHKMEMASCGVLLKLRMRSVHTIHTR